MVRFIIKGHFVPKQEAIEKGHKEHDWFYGKNETTLLDCPDGWSHPETGHLTESKYHLKEFGYSRKCDAVRKRNFLDKPDCDIDYWTKTWEVISVNV